MRIYDLLGSENLKLPYSNNILGIEYVLKERFERLLVELNNYAESIGNMEDVIESIRLSTGEIINSIHKYLLGDITGACIALNGVVERNKESIRCISKYYGRYIFRTYYRARLCTEKEKFFDKKEDFFHIPFEKRHLVKNQRYSVSGFPCMYLGATPYICYEELGRPKAEDMYFVKVEIPQNYNLMIMGLLPYEFKWHLYKHDDINNVEVIKNYLKMLPFIMACSVKVEITKREGAFKEEYIIPQLITQWLITSGREFDGILYFSTTARTHSRINYRLYQNLVLPVKDINSVGYCQKLSNEIKLTAPVSSSGLDFFKEYEWKYFEKDTHILNLPGNGRICKENGSEIHYSVSGFRLLEHMLSEKECNLLN